MSRRSVLFFTALLLAACLSACTGQSGHAESTDVPVTSIEHDATTAPAVTTASVATIAPAVTTIPVVTIAPAATTAPAVTTAPVVTTLPVETTVGTTDPEPFAEILPIEALNTRGEEGDHAEDDILRTSLEMNYRQISEASGHARLTNIQYPRLKKVAEDFYILFYYKNIHLYYTTSRDCMTWSDPVVFRRASDFPILGGEGIYYGRGPDAVVLDDGTILVAYAVHPSEGYKTDMDNHSIRVRRGFLTESKQLVWGTEKTVYVGMNWEPSFQLLEDGTIRLYFTQTAPYTSKYGFDDEIRSSGTGMLTSTDNGYTWTPAVTAGDTGYYRATTVYQQNIGTKTVTYGGEKITVPYFNGQMPVAVSLVDGRTLLAVEAHHLDDSYWISLATSKADGSWDALDFEEEGPATMQKDLFKQGAAPYLARFPSGEVLLTYRHDSYKTLYGRLFSADAAVYGEEFSICNDAKGSMGSCTVVDTHCVAAVNPFLHVQDDHTIQIVRSYLNHRINAPKAAVTLDGYTNDWTDNTDALFVGSESQAQVTLRVAHDDANVYLLFSRLDDYMVPRDYVSASIGVGENEYYTVTMATSGAISCHHYLSGAMQNPVEGAQGKMTALGTVGDNSDTDEGALYEISIPKFVLGLENADEFSVVLSLSNTDDGNTVLDTMTGIETKNTSNWPIVRLDP